MLLTTKRIALWRGVQSGKELKFMGIHVKFGTYTCENNELDKTDWLTMDVQWTDCQLVNTDILNPILKVSNGKVSSTYVEIQEFGRFYFVESVESIAGSHCLLHCHVDVLHTYRTGIKAMECLIARNEDKTKQAVNVVDNCMIIDKNRGFRNRGFGDSLITNEVSYVLGLI